MVLVDDCSTQQEGVQFCMKHYKTYISLSMVLVARMCKVTEEIKINRNIFGDYLFEIHDSEGKRIGVVCLR